MKVALNLSYATLSSTRHWNSFSSVLPEQDLVKGYECSDCSDRHTGHDGTIGKVPFEFTGRVRVRSGVDLFQQARLVCQEYNCSTLHLDFNMST